MIRAIAGVIALVTAFALTGALLGRLWAPLDSLAIVQPYLAGLLVLIALPRMLPAPARVGLIGLAAVGAFDILRLVGPGPTDEGPVLSHLQHNLHQGNPGADLPARLAEVEMATLQEVGEAIFALMELPPEWHLRICPRPGWVTTAALTRLPVIDSGCTPSGAAWIRLRTPDCIGGNGSLTLVSVHIFWPWPSAGNRQEIQVAGLATEIAALPRPVLIGGDFNQMPWSAAVGTLARAADGRVAGGLHATYTLAEGLLRLPIDHLIADHGLEVLTARGDRHGSDHRALLGRVRGLGAPQDCGEGA